MRRTLRQVTGTFRLAALCIVVTACVSHAMKIGTNLAGVADYSSSMPFVDIMKTARDWRTIGATDDRDYPHQCGDACKVNGRIPMDRNGYPLELPYNNMHLVTLFLTAQRFPCIPTGSYTLLFEGQGEITITNTHDKSVHTAVGTGGETRLSVPIASPTTGGGHLALRITRSVKGDHIRNVRFVMPGHENTYLQKPFNPAFLQTLQGFSVLRFMNWGDVVGPDVTDWNLRLTPDASHAGRAIKGSGSVPYEYMIDLCNTMLADMWVCVQHKTEEAYWRSLATLIRDRLNPKLKCYIEWSNETWNPMFPSYAYMKNRASALGIQENAGHTYFACRLFKTFDDVFAGQTHRIVKTLAGWHWVPTKNGVIIDGLKDPKVNPHGVKADAFATAPYVGNNALGSDNTAEKALAKMEAHIIDAVDKARQNGQKATAAGLTYITYEGGQHILKPGADVITAANSDPRIYGVYRKYLDAIAPHFDTFTHFNNCGMWTVHGAWGSRQYVIEPLESAHKARALVDYMTESGQLTTIAAIEPRRNHNTAPQQRLGAARLVPTRLYGLSGRMMTPAASGHIAPSIRIEALRGHDDSPRRTVRSRVQTDRETQVISGHTLYGP